MFDKESLGILRTQTAQDLLKLSSLYQECTYRLTVSSDFRVATLDYLVHSRATLDYLAHEIVRYCSSTPKKVYFPLAHPGLKREAFLDHLDSRWMPGLRVGHPGLFNYIDRLQWYAAGNETLVGLVKLVNSNKHIRLSLMEVADCEAVVVESPGHSAIQVGDRGLKSVAIAEGCTLRFEGPPGRYLSVRGPQLIDRDTVSLLDADVGVRLRRMNWREFKFDEVAHTTAMAFLAHVRTEVERICEQVVALVSTPDGS